MLQRLLRSNAALTQLDVSSNGLQVCRMRMRVLTYADVC
jgi:hypothetical protein